MRRIATLASATILLLTLPAPSGSAQEWRRDPTGWADGPITHTLNLPVGGGGAIGGTVHDGFLYVTTVTGFSIFDISTPSLPLLVSTTPSPSAINEGPTTNGEILLTSNDLGTPPSFQAELRVWDVSNKALPVQLSSILLPTPEHIYTCVLDCTFAYGAGGAVVDLRDPANPSFVTDWRDVAPIRSRHGMGSGRPGIVFTGSTPQHVLDASDPGDPQLLATVEPPASPNEAFFLVSYVDWPDGGEDRVALTTLETPFTGACTEDSGGLVTYDTKGWEDDGTFRVADVFRITQAGTPDQGLVPENAVGCSALGLDAHADFAGGGAVAVGWAENGVRLFGVGQSGQLTEAGGFIADGTEAFQPLWGDEETLYVVDTARGLDVFQVDVDELPGIPDPDKDRDEKDKSGKHGDKHDCKHPDKDADC